MILKNYKLNDLKKKAEKEIYFEYLTYADDGVVELSKYSDIYEAIDDIAWTSVPNDIYDLLQYVANNPELLKNEPHKKPKSYKEIHTYLSMSIYSSIYNHLDSCTSTDKNIYNY